MLKTNLLLALAIIVFFLNTKSEAHQKHKHPVNKKTSGVSDGNLTIGAWKYESCFYCHSLKPDVHLTGPSLANLFGKPAAQVKGFELYSEALKKSALVWNEENLQKFLFDPESVVSGTSMSFKGFRDKKAVQQLIDFLKVAMGPDGYKKVLDAKLLEPKMAGGQMPEDVSAPSDAETVTAIEHCGDLYKITVKNGSVSKYWQMNIEFKISSANYGPPKGKPAMLVTGSLGDRFVILFRDVEDMTKFVKSCR